MPVLLAPVLLYTSSSAARAERNGESAASSCPPGTWSGMTGTGAGVASWLGFSAVLGAVEAGLGLWLAWKAFSSVTSTLLLLIERERAFSRELCSASDECTWRRSFSIASLIR